MGGLKRGMGKKGRNAFYEKLPEVVYSRPNARMFIVCFVRVRACARLRVFLYAEKICTTFRTINAEHYTQISAR